MPMQHIVMVDIAAEMEQAFNECYDNVHIPEILECPGWLSATRRVCLEGGPKYVAIYEITGPEAYQSPRFQAIKGFGPFGDYVANFQRIRLGPLEDADGVVRTT